jgi:hypothetical protein
MPMRFRAGVFLAKSFPTPYPIRPNTAIMKRSLTLAAVLAVFSTTLTAQVQYPLNGGAELWTTGSFAGSTYDSLVHWDTPQRLGTALAVPDTVTFRTDMAYSGDFAVLMITKLVNIGGLIETEIPGSISTGTFFVNLFTQEFGVTGGMAIDCKPDNFSGFYQYSPFGADTANFQIYMFDAAGDTIADAQLQISDATTGGYQEFNLPITYTGSTDPAIVQILITSSGVGGQDGSTLYVDELVLSGNDCFTALFDDFRGPEALTLVPNPTANQIRFELPEGQGFRAEVTDLQGRVLRSVNAFTGLNTIDVRDFAAGMYLVRVSDASGRSAFAGRFEKH